MYTANYSENFSFFKGLEENDIQTFQWQDEEEAFLLLSRLLLCYIAFIR